uniref:Uncharacterized protein n=1 Tax=Anopheles atroparvus TaxID=41427 RepID=A0A182J0D4_ANOAO
MMQQEQGAGQEEGSLCSGPVPLPRPRQQQPQRAERPPIAMADEYEPVSVSYVNTHVSPPVSPPPGGKEPNRPIPAPRQRRRVLVLADYESHGVRGAPPGTYQNVVLRNAPVPPMAKPAPLSAEAPPAASNAPPVNGSNNRLAVGGGGQPRGANDAPFGIPPLPGKVNNNLHSTESSGGGSAVESDRLSVGSADSAGATGAKDGKYKTSSPADLFKTIGTTTRLLTEAIGERVAHKTKKAAHNVRSTGSSLVSWGTKPRASPKGAAEPTTTSPTARPQTLPSPEVIQKIRFGSPLNNAASAASAPSSGGVGEVGSDGPQTTYDVPRRAHKPSNRGRTPDSPSTAPSTSASSSARASSSSMASSSAGVTGLFQRNAPASQSLYSRVLPKHARRQGSPPARTKPSAEAPGLARTSKHKSESNLYESTFYVRRPEPARDSATHLYGKLNIIARPSLSSTSSEGSVHEAGTDSTVAGAGAGAGAEAGAGSDEDNTLPELLRTGVQLREQRPQTGSPSSSTRATCRSTASAANRAIFSRRISPTELPEIRSSPGTEQQQQQQHRSDSWNFYDIAAAEAKAQRPHGEAVADDEDGQEEEEEERSYASTPEPVYANDEQRRPLPSPIYDQLSEMESLSLLKPLPPGAATLRHDYDEVSIADIIDEFDPLGRGGATLEAILEHSGAYDGGTAGAAGGSAAAGSANLTLIESLLGAESYSRRRVPRRATKVVLASAGAEPAASRAIPKPPQRSDSLLVTGTPEAEAPGRAVPPPPKRAGKASRPAASVIVHQNLNLPGSVENLVELDERLIAPHLATVDGEGSAAGATAPTVDLSYPKAPQSSWYLEADGAAAAVAAADGRFEKRLNVDPLNERSSVTGRAEKAAKSSLPPELTGSQGSSIEEPAEVPVPSYFEAIGGTDPLFERGLAAAATVAPGPAPKPSTSVAAKLLNALKRRPSLNRGAGAGAGGSVEPGAAGTSVRTALAMVPRPRLTERFITHKGHVLKFPSGRIGDVLHELAPRSVVLRDRVFQTYLDPQQTLPKESIQLRFILSLQCILQHKFAGEGRLDLHCFEIVLGVPKGGAGGGEGGIGEGMSSTNPDLLITSGTSGNVKLARQSYMFGTHKRSDRNLWMARVLQSVTDVFGAEGEMVREFLRAGWCYVKQSVSAGWAGAWLLLAKRRLLLYSDAEGRLEELDLRKARCIGAIECEPGSIGCLHVEAGPCLFIDCPPYATLYLIMGSPRETQIWHKVIRQAAHKNGPTLHSQQLTRGDVPVLIDKCVNFIYAHGSMSEGIYRKSGSASAVGRILQLFGEDAFDVQLTRNEYSEYDVAGALKKFVRELPGSFFGSYAASFVAIGSLGGSAHVQLKVESYQQLLERLPRVEYCTLKKLLSHLAFIASLERHNRMGVANLAMIWGSTLLGNASQNTVQEPGSYHQQDADVVADLIQLYRRLFPVGEDELRKDQLMLAVLQKYHAAAENLSDAVKHSGDLKVWITIDCSAPPDGHEAATSATPEENPQVNVDVTPTKTASDVCKELATKTKYPWYKLTLYEVIANGALIRPIHYSEKVLEIVVRWTYWEEADRKHNYLTLKPTTTLNDVYRTIQKAPVLTPTMEVKFADRKTKGLRNIQLQLIGRTLVVLKKIEKKDKGFEELLKLDLSRMTAYIGCEPKRDRSSLRWAITLIDNDFKKRTREAPYIGHVFGGLAFASQILWYSSILYSHYKDDILPSGDLFF